MKFRPSTTVAVLGLLALIATGTIGYKIIAGSSAAWGDCFYMTVITLATVGYNEVIDLSGHPWGRMFNALLILFGMGALLYFVSHITASIVEGAIHNIFVSRAMGRKIRRCRGHYVVCGASELAHHIVKELIATGHTCVIVSNNEAELMALCDEMPKLLWVAGSPQEQSALHQAGAENAAGIFTTLDDDRDNLAVILAAKALDCTAEIVARAISPRARPKLLRAGAGHVVLGERICGNRLLAELLHPSEVSFLDMMFKEPTRTLRVEDAVVSAGSDLVGKSVPQARLRTRTGGLVLAIRRSDGSLAPPYRTTIIEPGDTIVAITDLQAKANLRRLAQHDPSQTPHDGVATQEHKA